MVVLGYPAKVSACPPKRDDVFTARRRVFALSIHADYRCRHSGACCTADWDVPVELPLYRTLDEALNSARLAPAAASDEGAQPLIVEADLPEDAAAMVARTSTGDCVFYHHHSGLCVIHRDLGEPMLPATCRYFPRLAVRDARGTSISLTHYCPTAAESLFRDDVPVAIVESPRAFPEADYEGLVVTEDDWPPLLRPGVLADAASYAAWERHMVARCVDPALSPESVIATLERDARSVRAVTPVSGESISRAIAHLPACGVAAGIPETLEHSLAHLADVIAAVPEEWRPEPDIGDLEGVYAREVRPCWSRWNAPLKRYLAAKAFASWTAYQGRGFLTIVHGIDAALALVRVEAARHCRDARRPLDAALLQEAFRQADFALNHLAAGDELAERWSKVEA
jgi:Fe-S-cluster containining protein